MNRTKKTARRALVARVESLEGRISLSSTGLPYKPPAVTTITLVPPHNAPPIYNSFRFG